MTVTIANSSRFQEQKSFRFWFPVNLEFQDSYRNQKREPLFPLFLNKRLAEEMVSGADKLHATKVAPLSFETARTAKKSRKQ